MWTPTVLKRVLGHRRVSLNDMKAAVEIINAIKIPDNATIIEIGPGSGFLTHAFLRHTNARKILALEKDKKYADVLSVLAEESNGRLEVLYTDTWNWKTYDMLKIHLNYLQVHPWNEVHPNLISLIHLPNSSKGEILINRLLSNCYNKSGLHYFGRSKMNFIVPEKPAEKLLARKGELQRHKIKVEIEAISEIEVLKIFSEKAFIPHVQCALFEATPLVEPKLQATWYTFQYVIKVLMSRKNAKLTEMMSTLGAGANILAKELSFNPNLPIRNMTVENYNEVSVLFENWPFKPQHIDDEFEPPPNHRKKW